MLNLFFKPKVVYSEAPLKVVALFLNYYVQVMREEKDSTDRRMKDYLFHVVTGLGVPTNVNEEIEIETEALPLEVLEERAPIIIHRRDQNGIGFTEGKRETEERNSNASKFNRGGRRPAIPSGAIVKNFKKED